MDLSCFSRSFWCPVFARRFSNSWRCFLKIIKIFVSNLLKNLPHFVHFLFNDISQFLNFDWFIIEKGGRFAQLGKALQFAPCFGYIGPNQLAFFGKRRFLSQSWITLDLEKIISFWMGKFFFIYHLRRCTNRATDSKKFIGSILIQGSTDFLKQGIQRSSLNQILEWMVRRFLSLLISSGSTVRFSKTSVLSGRGLFSDETGGDEFPDEGAFAQDGTTNR